MAGPLCRIRDWLVRHKERIGLIMLGHAANRVQIIVFDHILYGAVVIYATSTWGPVWGSLATFAIMLPLSALTCVALLRFYDWAKKDWLGIEAIKELRDGMEGGGRFKRLVMRIARMGDVPAYVVLTLFADPLVTTLYLRKGAERYDGLTRRDKWIFATSIVFSNAYWTLRWTVIVEVIRYILILLF